MAFLVQILYTFDEVFFKKKKDYGNNIHFHKHLDLYRWKEKIFGSACKNYSALDIYIYCQAISFSKGA